MIISILFSDSPFEWIFKQGRNTYKDNHQDDLTTFEYFLKGGGAKTGGCVLESNRKVERKTEKNREKQRETERI